MNLWSWVSFRFFGPKASPAPPEPIDIEDATEASVPQFDAAVLGSSVELIVRHHFDPTTVHDQDLTLFARAAVLIGEGAMFLDIGANVGNTIASLAALDCRFNVHAFEINPALHAHLRHATAIYPGHCTIHPYGLGAAAERSWLYLPALRDMFMLGEASLSLAFLQEEASKARMRSYLPGEALRVGKMPVEIRTLDSARLSPDFVKIDVVGVEDRVIAGASETLRRCRPLIMVENSYPERVRAALAPFGYTSFNFDVAQGLLYPQDRPLQNGFYVDERWAARLHSAGLLSMNRGASFSDVAMAQDAWVVNNVFPGRTTPGFFIEAGAADGYHASNTYLLETVLGWDGLCCEPNRKMFTELQKRRRCRVMNCALADRDGEAEFIEAGWYGTLTESAERIHGQFTAHQGLFAKNFDGSDTERFRVSVRSLDSVLEEISAPETIDYLSLDVEGGELAVLSCYPFAKRRILCMTVECRYPDENGKLVEHAHCTPLRDLLLANGYALVKTAFVDDFFVHCSTLHSYRP